MIAALLPIIGTVLDRVIPDNAAKEKAKTELEAALIQNANAINLAIQDVNKTEAAHRSIWVAGWRPAIGWACAAGFFWAFLGAPLAEYIVMLSGHDVPLPDMDTAPLIEMTFAMLGLAGLRTYEKQKGVTK